MQIIRIKWPRPMFAANAFKIIWEQKKQQLGYRRVMNFKLSDYNYAVPNGSVVADKITPERCADYQFGRAQMDTSNGLMKCVCACSFSPHFEQMAIKSVTEILINWTTRWTNYSILNWKQNKKKPKSSEKRRKQNKNRLRNTEIAHRNYSVQRD